MLPNSSNNSGCYRDFNPGSERHAESSRAEWRVAEQADIRVNRAGRLGRAENPGAKRSPRPARE